MFKENINVNDLISKVDFLINDIQKNLSTKSKKFQLNNTRVAKNYDEFKKLIKEEVLFWLIGMELRKLNKK